MIMSGMYVYRRDYSMYDRCDVRTYIVNALGHYGLQHVEQNTLYISEVVHNHVKIGYKLVHYMCESEAKL